MKLTLVAVGHRLPVWMQAGFDEYAKRMPAEARIELIELKPATRSASSVARAMADEAQRIETAVPKQAQRVVLDERGKSLTTVALAGWLRDWMASGDQPCFIIGGADGLDDSIKQSAHRTLALSTFTLPHGLVRVMLAEQLYRAWSLIQNHPYHRE